MHAAIKISVVKHCNISSGRMNIPIPVDQVLDDYLELTIIKNPHIVRAALRNHVAFIDQSKYCQRSVNADRCESIICSMILTKLCHINIMHVSSDVVRTLPKGTSTVIRTGSNFMLHRLGE